MNIRTCYGIIEYVIEKYFFAKKNDLNADDLGEIAIFASSMSLFEDEDCTTDPAMWEDWIEIVGNNKSELTIEEGYNTACRFLLFYADLMNSQQILIFIQQLTFEKWCAVFEEVSKKECMKLTKEESISNYSKFLDS